MLTHVDKPLTIGKVTVKNRVFRSAHGTMIGGGTVNEDFIAYHEARAKGGVGLTVLETMSPHPSSETLLNIWDPNLPEMYPRLAERMHRHGMKVFQQINHCGANSWAVGGGPAWGVSDLPGLIHQMPSVPMTKAMIDTVIASYADAARKLVQWGLDGVEVHGAHGYLIAQFLSPNSNKRTDDYGGSFENRCRFGLEVARAVRAALPNAVVGMRLSPEMITGGLDEDDNLRFARMLVDESLVNYVSLSQGVYQSLHRIIGGMHEPTGYQIAVSERVTRPLKILTMVIGRFRTLEEADEVIRSGAADMVGFTRATIADPDLVRKNLEGKSEQVRPCIACNQGCQGGLHVGRLGCIVNPAAGFERSLADDLLTPAVQRKNVLVVGGGPAGMEAARVAALRGHKVTLAEARPKLGGALRFAAMAPTRQAIGDVNVWLEQEIYRLGVDVRLNTCMEEDDVLAESADVIVIATGSTPRMDGIQISNPGEPIAGMDGGNVLSSWDVFSDDKRDFGKTAVVIDDLGHYEAVAVAEHLASHGAHVTFVTRHVSFAPQMDFALMNIPALQRLSHYGFDSRVRTRAIRIEGDGVVIGPTYLAPGSNRTEKIPADTVVFVSFNHANRELYARLEGRGLDVHVIGDSNSPRLLAAAIREGNLVGRTI